MTETPSDVSSASPSGREAPSGIKLICILYGVISLFIFFYVAELIKIGGTATIIGVALGVANVLHYIAFYGLWTVRSWGWTLGVILFAIGLLVGVFLGNVISIVVQAIIIVYFFTTRGYYHDI